TSTKTRGSSRKPSAAAAAAAAAAATAVGSDSPLASLASLATAPSAALSPRKRKSPETPSSTGPRGAAASSSRSADRETPRVIRRFPLRKRETDSPRRIGPRLSRKQSAAASPFDEISDG